MVCRVKSLLKKNMKNRSEKSPRAATGDSRTGKPDRRKRTGQRAGTKIPSAESFPAPGKASRPASGRSRRAEHPRTAAPADAEAKPQAARLHKVMAASGLGSRRALEQEIRAGAVQLNDAVATLGQSIKSGDRLKWGEREWRVVGEQSQHRTLIYNKPEGEITSRSDPEGRPTVFDRLPPLEDARWVPIGRLDINTTGLLLLTTDGELANAMMHPSSQVDREYVCRVRGLVSDEQVEQLKTGVMLDDGLAHFNDLTRMGDPNSHQPGANQWYQVTLLEGRNREVRRLWESMDHMVSRLKRVRYGAALLPKNLKMGQWAEVTAKDHQVLREDVGLPRLTAELSLQLLVNRQQTSHKHSSRSSRAQGKHLATPTDGQNPWASGRPGKRARSQAHDRSAGKKPGAQESPRQGAAGRVAASRRVTKPGSPAGGGRRPGSKPRRGDR